jgi:hypothetical protein
MRTRAEIVRSPGILWMTLGDTFYLWTEDISGTGQKLVAGSAVCALLRTRPRIKAKSA